MNLLRAVALAVVVLLVACRTAKPRPEQAVTPASAVTEAPPAEGKPGLRFRVEPPDAEVIIDEQSYGPAAQLTDIALAPGIYRVAVKAPGHTTWRMEVAVGSRMETLQIVLPRRQ